MVRLSRKYNMIELSEVQINKMLSYIEAQIEVKAFYLFGSYATEYQTCLSDVDFAVLLQMPSPLKVEDSLEKELEILSKLQQIGDHEDINVVNLLKAPVTLQMKVLEEGNLLFCRDQIYLANFKESVIRRYCDFEPDLRAIYKDYDAGLREEYLHSVASY